MPNDIHVCLGETCLLLLVYPSLQYADTVRYKIVTFIIHFDKSSIHFD